MLSPTSSYGVFILLCLTTCNEEKGNKTFTPRLTSSLVLCWTQAEGEGSLEERCCVNCLLGERLLPRIRHGEVCNSIAPFSSTFQMKSTRRGASTTYIRTTLVRHSITSWTGSWKHQAFLPCGRVPQRRVPGVQDPIIIPIISHLLAQQ